jgi:hypothetical protein
VGAMYTEAEYPSNMGGRGTFLLILSCSPLDGERGTTEHVGPGIIATCTNTHAVLRSATLRPCSSTSIFNFLIRDLRERGERMDWITLLLAMDFHGLVYVPRCNDLPTFTSSATTRSACFGVLYASTSSHDVMGCA